MINQAVLEDIIKTSTTLLAPAVAQGVAFALKVKYEHDWSEVLTRNVNKATMRRLNRTPSDVPKYFAEYLAKSYAKHYYVNTVVAPGSPKAMHDLYIPATLESIYGLPLSASVAAYTARLTDSRPYQRIRLSDYKVDAGSSVQYMMIVDTAGMGKSTISKHLFLSGLIHIHERRMVPILFELRRLSKDVKLIDIILSDLSPITQPTVRTASEHSVNLAVGH